MPFECMNHDTKEMTFILECCPQCYSETFSHREARTMPRANSRSQNGPSTLRHSEMTLQQEIVRVNKGFFRWSKYILIESPWLIWGLAVMENSIKEQCSCKGMQMEEMEIGSDFFPLLSFVNFSRIRLNPYLAQEKYRNSIWDRFQIIPWD